MPREFKIRQESSEARNPRTVIGRLFPETDLIDGIKEICRSHAVRNGVIVSCVGSLRIARFVWAVPDPFPAMGFCYGPPKVIAGPLELVSGQGTLGAGQNPGGAEQLSVHLHAVMTDDSGATWSGHIVEKGNIVLVTAEIAILAFDYPALVRVPDAETEAEIFRTAKR